MAKIGTVQFITGIVKAISTNGTERVLHVGDKVQANEKIITGAASTIVIAFDDGTRLDLGRDSQIVLTEESVTATTDSPETLQANTQQTAQTEVDALQKALQDENFDPTKALPATAAGGATGAGGAGTGNQGHTFVTVDYLNPQLTPENGFETQGIVPTVAEIPIEILILNPGTGAAPVNPVPEPPTISSIGLANDNVPEGTDLAYTVNLSGSSTTPVTYTFTLGGGSASPSDYGNPVFSNGVTYDPSTGQITVPAGVASFTVTVPTTDDSLHEDTETVPLSIGGVTGTGGILDNDPVPSILTVEPGAPGTGDDNVTEGNNLVYTVSLTGSSATSTNFTFSLGGGSASASDYGSPVFSNGVTYDAGTGQITVPAGIASFTVTVPTTDDSLHEDTEAVPLSIGGVTGTGGILDNDPVPSILTVEPGAPGTGDDNVTEGNNLVYTVNLSGSSTTPVTYAFTLGGGSASTSDYGSPVFSNGVTYDAGTGQITVPAGVASFTVTVPTTDDSLHEDTETVPLSIGSVTGTGGILDNDPVPSILTVEPGAPGTGDDTVTEGNNLVYTVSLTGSSATPSVFSFTLGGGTASPSDYGSPVFSNGVTYDASTGQITVPAGVTSFTVTVATTDDSLHEDTETVPLSIGGVTGTGGILDNDPMPSILTVEPGAPGTGDDNVTEGNNLAYTVTLTGSSATSTNFTFSLGGGSASASDYGSPVFSNGVTYDPGTGQITVPAGVANFTVSVPTTDDNLHEDTETVPLSIGGVTGTGGILDNDPVPSILTVEPGAPGTGDDNVTEGNNLAYTVTLTGSSATSTNFTFSLGGGSASASDYGSPVFSNGVTYDPGTGQITVPAGVANFTVSVPTTDDNLHEDTETVPLSIGGVTGTGGILDNDPVPSILTVEPGAPGTGDDNITEGNNLVYTVTLTGSSATSTNFSFTLGGGTASQTDYGSPVFSNGVTYDASTGQITVPAGVASFTVTVPTTDDSLHEDTETVPLSIGGVTGTGGILDNDPVPSISRIEPNAVGPGDDYVNEGKSLEFNVTLSGSSAVPVSYNFSLGGGSATSPDDYLAPQFNNGVTYDPITGQITVPAGVTSFKVTVQTIDDAVHENTETVPLSIGGVTSMGGILDNDPIPTISQIKPNQDYVQEGKDLVFDVSLNGISAVATSYAFSLGGGTASPDDYGLPQFDNGVTYDSSTGQITVPAGVIGFKVTVPTIDDTRHEDTETVPISIGGVNSQGGILDNDSPTVSRVELGVGHTNVLEGTDLVYTVTLRAATGIPVNYAFNLGGGSASPTDYGSPHFNNGVTYDAGTGQITVPAGVITFTVVVPTVIDSFRESTETVPLSIGGFTGIGGILDRPGVSRIEPNAIGPGDDYVPEGKDLEFNVTLNGSALVPVSYDFSLGGGTATSLLDYGLPQFNKGVTYNPSTGQITVPAGVSNFKVIVPTIIDGIKEEPETVSINIDGVGRIGGIHDNTPPVLDLDADNSHNIMSTQHIAGLFNTGADAAGNKLGLGDIDLHYSQATATGPVTTQAIELSYAWIPASASTTSNWIGSTANNPVGLYQYQTSFNLDANADPASVQIAFDIAFDNSLRDILVNGVSTGFALTGQGNGIGFSQYSHVQLSGANTVFSNTHTNTITFVVDNRDQINEFSAGPTGLRIDNMQTSVSVIGTDLINHQADYAGVYVEGKPLSIGDNDVIIRDADADTMQSATISLTNTQVGDVLQILGTLPGGITPDIDMVTNTIVLSGQASLADYQQAIKTIYFNNTTDNPNTTVARVITVVVNDGQADSNVATSTIKVVAAADNPVLDLNGAAIPDTGYTAIYAPGSAGVAIASANTLVTDVDSASLASATIHISNVFAGDLLVASNLPSGIQASIYDPVTGTITLSGEASLTDYQTAIEHINFKSDSSSPEVSPRVIGITVNDGAVNSQPVYSTIDVAAHVVTGSDGDDKLSASNSGDLLIANAGNDLLFGGNGNDLLLGGEGDDVLFGGPGNDVLNGGTGNDLLTGGAGADMFTWHAGQTGTDTVADFTVGKGGDSLNLADLLQGEHNDSGSLSSFLAFDYDAGSKATTITIDADKTGQGSAQTQSIVLQNVDLTASGTLSNVDIINNLLANGNIQTDV